MENRNVQAMIYMQSLMKDSYLPFTNFSLKPINLAIILNDIIINRRTSILEFGSGISTIIIARLIKKNNLNAKIFSIEHDENYVNFIQEYIDKEDLNYIVGLIHAPLKSPSTFNANEWYDENSIKPINYSKFDMVIIDGPPAWESHKEESRYPAFPFVIDKLSENAIVYLDDCGRKGEKKIINVWENNFNIKFKKIGENLCYYNKGNFLNPNIL